MSTAVLLCIICTLLVGCNGDSDDQKSYVIYMGEIPNKAHFSASSVHTSMLQQVVGSRGSESLLYSYKRSFNGFVAKLTTPQMHQLAGMDGVISVFPNEKKQLHTTRSWDFTGLTKNSPRKSTESDIIIGMIDTGIWPESESFSDRGFGPPPAKWKGSCPASVNFTCNNKIIGGKYYRSEGPVPSADDPSPRDTAGHGTHTASTAAGSLVSQASLFGLGLGTARGGVPSARVSVYKVCWSDGCYDSDILAAFDDAIADGVDIISLSIGGFFVKQYFEDSIAIGAFHAMKNGILTSNSAGNSGPGAGSITNVSPWSLSVAASTIDRKFVAQLQLGNGEAYEGVSVNTFDLKEATYPLIYGGDAPNVAKNYTGEDSRFCSVGTLDKTRVKGKIVLCDSVSQGLGALGAGAAGTVMQDDGFKDVAFTFPIPTTYLNSTAGKDVLNYVKASKPATATATATILKSTSPRDDFAPAVVSFSSRGPNLITSDILKPDLTAPGVDILAAWSLASTVTELPEDTRHVPYNIISGTSMSCPHVTGAAAYVKSFWPTWSPAAIKSALMTSASPMNPSKNEDAEFAYGSGHISPLKATNPGLIYDIGVADYVKFLCGQGVGTKNLRLITGDTASCSDATNGTVWDLNYPSFAMSTTDPTTPLTRVFHRTVTNVGSPNSVYKATVSAPKGLNVTVEPSVLTFQSVGQKLSFTLTVQATIFETDKIVGTLIWYDGSRSVRSPVVAYLST